VNPELQKISDCLLSQELVAELDEEKRLWTIPFDVSGKIQSVLLYYPADADYLMLASFVDSATIENRSVDSLPAPTLATLIKASSGVLFSKLTYVSESHGYMATSECSIEGVTGQKLHRRLEACARLAAALEGALDVE